MDSMVIHGGKRIEGELTVQGAKNSALPILAAAVASDGISVIDNCPGLTDIEAAFKILTYLGCKVSRNGGTVTVDATGACRCDVPQDLMHEMRSSIVFLGPLLARMGKADLSTPGGCEIGLRPIDLHISAMRQLGSSVTEEYGRIFCNNENGMHGADISLSFPSVGATENIMIAASTATGTTIVTNAAREPEIVDLADYLNSCGADISGAGDSTLVIKGVKKLHGAHHRVIPDRIITTTYMTAAAVTGGTVILNDTIPGHLTSVIDIIGQAGCRVTTEGSRITLVAPERLKATETIRTMPYPGFPTDAQALIMVMSAISDGTGVIIESIFENRFKHVGELNRMGANIKTEGRMAVVKGVKRLYGTQVFAGDLRGGTALVLAGLAAEGITTIMNTSHIDRGCQDIRENLIALGAQIANA